MIFFVANDGTVISSVPSPVYQGAANTNNIYLVAPFAENLQASVVFKLPNGVYTTRYPMVQASNLTGIVEEKTGKTFNGWQFSLPNRITQYYGTVTAQFFFYSAKGGVVTATSAAAFVVEKGVPEILPDKPSDDVYEAILNNLSALSQQLNNGSFTARSIYGWNSEYAYGANEIVFYPNIGEYGAFVKSLKVGNQTEPFVDGILNSENWILVSDFNILTDLYGLKVETQEAVKQSQANANAAASSAATAENAMADAQNSVEVAQSAAESIKSSADYLESIRAGTVAVPKAENAINAVNAQNSEAAQNDGAGNNIANQFSEVVSDIKGLREDISNESHFRGMFDSVAALRAAYPTATPNDYAYIVGGNQWIYQNGTWTDSGISSPNTSVPASNSAPLMDGAVSAGSSAQYARGDHRHPNDTSKVNKSGDTMTGSLTFQGEGEGLKYKSGNRDAYALRFFQGTEQGYGDLVQLGDGGTTIVGAGESADTVRERLQTYDTETLYLAADDTVEIIAGADSYSYGNPTVSITPNGLYEKGSRVFSSNNKPAATDLLAAHPVDSIYISTNSTSPASLFGGSWTPISSGYYLKAVTSEAGTYGYAGLPNITGEIRSNFGEQNNLPSTTSGALSKSSGDTKYQFSGNSSTTAWGITKFDASRNGNDAIYGKSTTVTPLNYGVYMWRRTA